jgi:hypothetical protein
MSTGLQLISDHIPAWNAGLFIGLTRFTLVGFPGTIALH